MRLRIALVSCLLAGCASPLTEARTSFDEGRYPDAVEQYTRLGTEARRLPPRELFDYALYRGLSHLALGDAKPADRWLTLAKRLSDSSPTLVSLPERNRLLSARRAMGHAPGD